VKDQRTYFDVNLAADQDPKILQLRSIARKFRDSRLAAGAVHISVPEINIWIGSRRGQPQPGEPRKSGTDAGGGDHDHGHWLMARFLAEHRTPAIFRSQPDPRERLYQERRARCSSTGCSGAC